MTGRHNRKVDINDGESLLSSMECSAGTYLSRRLGTSNNRSDGARLPFKCEALPALPFDSTTSRHPSLIRRAFLGRRT